MFIPRLVIGVALLTLGRKVFWLFVGGVGFVLGINLATQVIRVEPIWAVFVIALVGGLLGALLALFLQELAIGLAGFLAGGYLALNLVEVLGWEVGRWVRAPYGRWLVFIVGGVICAALIGVVFEWALIVLSSVTGATLVVQAIRLRPGIEMLLFAILVGAGIVIQAILLQRERSPSPDL